MSDTVLVTTIPAARPDALLAALLFLARHFGRPVSPDAVTRGLPLEEGRLPLAYVAEAAERAGMVARETTLLRAGELRPLTLPVMALTRDGGVWVILRRKGDRLLVVGHRLGLEGTWLSVAELDAELDGRGYFVQSKLYFDGRSQLYEPMPNKDWFWGPLRANSWTYGFAALASMVINGLATLTACYVMAVYDRVIPNRAIDTLWVLTSGVVVLYLADLVLKSIRGYLIDSASRRFDYEVGSRVFAKALSLSPGDRPSSAGTLANTIREFESLRDFFTSATLTVLGDLPFLLAFLGVLAAFAGPVAWVPVVAIPVILGLSLAFLWPMGRLTDESYRESAQRNALLYETVTGLEAVRAMGAQAWVRRRWDQLLASNTETLLKSRHLAHLSLNTTLTVQSLAGVGVVVAASLLVAEGKLSTGAMVACGILAGRALQPLAQVAGLISRVHTTRASLAALDKLMQTPDEDASKTPLLHMPRLRGEVAFRNVQYAYPPAAGAATPVAALNGLDFTVKPGESVALLGRVGSGKSTLLGLILKLYAPQAGHVTVDGLDVRQIASADLRAQIGYVAQEPMLFHGTVRENLTMGHPGATDEQVLAAARTAGLDELLASTAEGLNLPVGEAGRRLSGGMRQAVAIARALVDDPPILLMDEPTSMMDHTTEQRLIARLAEARKGKTTIVVTHRPALLNLVDRVVVVEGGRVVADGPKDQVLTNLSRPS